MANSTHYGNPAGPAHDAAALQGTVLYIEDEPINVVVVQGMLSLYPGVRLLHAGTGGEGVALVREARPDFVLLDMHLPDMSGLEVVRRLNVDIAERGLRVTILTGDSLNIEIIKAMSLGAFEYWTKPLERRQFEDGLRRALTGRTPNPARTLATGRAPPAPGAADPD